MRTKRIACTSSPFVFSGYHRNGWLIRAQDGCRPVGAPVIEHYNLVGCEAFAVLQNPVSPELLPRNCMPE